MELPEARSSRPLRGMKSPNRSKHDAPVPTIAARTYIQVFESADVIFPHFFTTVDQNEKLGNPKYIHVLFPIFRELWVTKETEPFAFNGDSVSEDEAPKKDDFSTITDPFVEPGVTSKGAPCYVLYDPETKLKLKLPLLGDKGDQWIVNKWGAEKGGLWYLTDSMGKQPKVAVKSVMTHIKATPWCLVSL